MKIVCENCESFSVIKSGFTNENKQRYQCKNCNTRFIQNYTYQAYKKEINEQIVLLTKEGLGIRSTARVLQISTTTLLKRIIFIAKNISPPLLHLGKTYEVDEIRTFIQRKDRLIWIVCALERENRRIIRFSVGRRTNKTLNKVLQTLVLSQAKNIFTDKLKHYRHLLNSRVHKTKKYGTNHIERNHLTLRTHLKRLNRRTLCFSRNMIILISILKIYFWY